MLFWAIAMYHFSFSGIKSILDAYLRAGFMPQGIPEPGSELFFASTERIKSAGADGSLLGGGGVAVKFSLVRAYA